MHNLLPIGSIVRLHNGTLELMIAGRYPLYNKAGEIGYFEYAAYLYPTGLANEQVYYFNQENIEEVLFEGYINDKEKELQKLYQDEEETIQYPRFSVQ